MKRASLANVLILRSPYSLPRLNLEMKLRTLALTLALIWLGWLSPSIGMAQFGVPDRAEDCIRIATYNVSLNRRTASQLTSDLNQDQAQIESVAAIIRAVRPDVLLLNELDFSTESNHAQQFADRYLAADRLDSLGRGPWEMPFQFSRPVNTGVPSGLDLNGNGSRSDPEDAWGYGRFPGQYGMAVLSRFAIQQESAHTLQRFRWSQLPDALRPYDENANEFYYDQKVWSKLRLPSKSFWDLPIDTPLGRLHVLASHPTPPAFDGPEDRNGCRNHDEIKLIQHYIDGAEFLLDDQGCVCGLENQDAFVILGDLNSDPHDGGSRTEAILGLLNHRRVAQFPAPTSQGAVAAAEKQKGKNTEHSGNPAEDTGDFSDQSVGNLRIDYVLPSRNFRIVASGVFWPELSEIPEQYREALQKALAASDHHLVWVDMKKAE